MRSSAVFVGVIVLSVFAMVSRAEAQVLYGSVVVEARDQSGGGVPGADVTVLQIETGVTRDAVTNGVGVATIPNLPPGTYTVRVNIAGFRESVTMDAAARAQRSNSSLCPLCPW